MIDKTGNNDWYVLQTRSRYEKKVVNLLTRTNIEVYLPLIPRTKQWSDRIKLVEEPLFSGYVFVKYDESNRYQILNTPGVVRFVSFDGEYATIRPAQMEIIKSIPSVEQEAEVIDLSILPGEQVLISNGPFKGICAKLIQMKGKEKILLEVEAIGKGVLLEIGKTKIERISKVKTV